MYSRKGKPMLFFIMACAMGMWASDFAHLELHQWTDSQFGDGGNYFVGVVLSHWEFVAGDSSSSTDEGIYVDMAKLNHKGGNGILVYKALESLMLDGPPSFEYPTTPFKLLQHFQQHLCKLCTGHQQFAGSLTVKAQIRKWQAAYNVATFPMHVVRMCPKSAFMSISGWSVWHAVPVSRKHRGTAVIGTVVQSLEVYVIMVIHIDTYVLLLDLGLSPLRESMYSNNTSHGMCFCALFNEKPVFYCWGESLFHCLGACLSVGHTAFPCK